MYYVHTVVLFISAMANYMVLAEKRLRPSAAAGGRKTAPANLLEEQMMVHVLGIMRMRIQHALELASTPVVTLPLPLPASITKKPHRA